MTQPTPDQSARERSVRISFTKELPTEKGRYLWRDREGSSIQIVDTANVPVGYIEGEWCGPLIEGEPVAGPSAGVPVDDMDVARIDRLIEFVRYERKWMTQGDWTVPTSTAPRATNFVLSYEDRDHILAAWPRVKASIEAAKRAGQGAGQGAEQGVEAPDREPIAEGDCRYYREPQRPRIVCLCGSGRFKEAFDEAEFQETLAGKIVLTIGCNTKDIARTPDLEHHKPMLDELHLRKIDIADEVLVLNVNGYVGESTRREMEYAKSLGRPIRLWSEENAVAPTAGPKAGPGEPNPGTAGEAPPVAVAESSCPAGSQAGPVGGDFDSVQAIHDIVSVIDWKNTDTDSSSYKVAIHASGRQWLAFVLAWPRLRSRLSAPPQLLAERGEHPQVALLLEQVYELDAKGESRKAMQPIVDALDDWLNAGKFEECRRLLARADVARFSDPVLISALGITCAAARKLNPEREDYYQRALAVATERRGEEGAHWLLDKYLGEQPQPIVYGVPWEACEGIADKINHDSGGSDDVWSTWTITLRAGQWRAFRAAYEAARRGENPWEKEIEGLSKLLAVSDKQREMLVAQIDEMRQQLTTANSAREAAGAAAATFRKLSAQLEAVILGWSVSHSFIGVPSPLRERLAEAFSANDPGAPLLAELADKAKRLEAAEAALDLRANHSLHDPLGADGGQSRSLGKCHLCNLDVGSDEAWSDPGDGTIAHVQCELVDELKKARTEVTRLKHACAAQNNSICQTLGKALDYPLNGPDSPDDQEGSVVVGEMTAEAMADEAAKVIAETKAKLAQAETRIAQLETDVERLTKRGSETVATLAKAHVARIAELEAVLRKVEWHDVEGTPDHCPVCRGMKCQGHKRGCELDAALKGNEPTVDPAAAPEAGAGPGNPGTAGEAPPVAVGAGSQAGPVVGDSDLMEVLKALDKHIQVRTDLDLAIKISDVGASLTAMGILSDKYQASERELFAARERMKHHGEAGYGVRREEGSSEPLAGNIHPLVPLPADVEADLLLIEKELISLAIDGAESRCDGFNGITPKCWRALVSLWPRLRAALASRPKVKLPGRAELARDACKAFNHLSDTWTGKAEGEWLLVADALLVPVTEAIVKSGAGVAVEDDKS